MLVGLSTSTQDVHLQKEAVFFRGPLILIMLFWGVHRLRPTQKWSNTNSCWCQKEEKQEELHPLFSSRSLTQVRKVANYGRFLQKLGLLPLTLMSHMDCNYIQSWSWLYSLGTWDFLTFWPFCGWWMGCRYNAYSFSIIPAMGQIVSGDRASYQYLVESIRKFPTQVCCLWHDMFMV